MNDPLIIASPRAWLAALVCAAASAFAPTASAALPPGYTMARTGDVRDFDYFAGGWRAQQRRLKARGVGSTEWYEFPTVLCMTPYLGHLVTVDELHMPTLDRSGLSLRTFDVQKRQWSIYWVSSATGKLDPIPTVGGFQGSHGEFYAEDEDEGRPVKVRYIWDKLDADHARWQQAFSFDDSTWETNWTAEFTRGEAGQLCEHGQPRRP